MNEQEFGHKIAQHLNQGADDLPAATVEALAQARRRALAQPRRGFHLNWRWAGPALAAALVAAIAVYHSGDDLVDAEHRLEAELLHHELPPHAFSDEGFDQWLKTQPEP
ncbi:MAG: DUF3619 family protein [Betaproteobacteria bacterium]|nr:DUF3619 family protein [Betaproteobacteria bacterium]